MKNQTKRLGFSAESFCLKSILLSFDFIKKHKIDTNYNKWNA